MYVLISVVLIISMYEFLSSRSWQLVTSDKRNDIVFDNRNKAYGAYQIRRNYDKALLLIMFSVLAGVAAVAGLYSYFSSISKHPGQQQTLTEDGKKDKYETYTFELDLTPKEIEPQQQVKTNPQTVVQNLAYKVVDRVVNTNVTIIDNPNTNTGVTSHQGTEGGFSTGLVPGSGGGGVVTTVPEPKAPPVIEKDPDVTAEFPGGRDKLMAFLRGNLVYPESGLQIGAQGRVYLSFVIDKEGKLSSIKVMRGVPDCPECDAEAIRVLKKMPNWKPAVKNGNKVDSYFSMPVNFSIK